MTRQRKRRGAPDVESVKVTRRHSTSVAAKGRSIRVLACDPDPVVQYGIREMVAPAPHIRIAQVCSTGFDLLEAARGANWDLLILSVELGDVDGIDLLTRLRHDGVATPALFFCDLPSRIYGVRALREGAWGFLSKDSQPEEMIRAIETIYAGKRYIDQELAEGLAAFVAGSHEPGPELLSNREFQVLCMIADGARLNQIADRLSISLSAVNSCRRLLLKKLRLKRNVDFTRYALMHGLIDQEVIK